MATMAIVGITWGDEGKGRMVDLVAEDFQVVCRYQGGNNAGHTVVNQLGTFKLNLLPSGICRENVMKLPACAKGALKLRLIISKSATAP